ncbi:MAG: aldo/keto reductase [Saprospiraceae bacterium]
MELGADKKESQQIFDTYAEHGGNFVDTANRYTEGTSERWLGEFIKQERHHFVLATKFTLRDELGDQILEETTVKTCFAP